jgi:hypothetical protein
VQSKMHVRRRNHLCRYMLGDEKRGATTFTSLASDLQVRSGVVGVQVCSAGARLGGYWARNKKSFGSSSRSCKNWHPPGIIESSPLAAY